MLRINIINENSDLNQPYVLHTKTIVVWMNFKPLIGYWPPNGSIDQVHKFLQHLIKLKNWSFFTVLLTTYIHHQAWDIWLTTLIYLTTLWWPFCWKTVNNTLRVSNYFVVLKNGKNHTLAYWHIYQKKKKIMPKKY